MSISVLLMRFRVRYDDWFSQGPGIMTGYSGRRSGEVMHYIADYFTFPHNKTFDGTLYQHNTYEKHLKNELKAFVLEGKADVYTEKEIHFETLNQLLQYIKEHHRRYLNCKRNIDDDIHYILTVCYQVFQGLFQLCRKNGIADYAYAVM